MVTALLTGLPQGILKPLDSFACAIALAHSAGRFELYHSVASASCE
ncbi:MAG: hypothetical protein AAF892_16850 [Cyanobacteria bacterium P01_D01_bin.71]